jgi:Zn-dependent protease/CBS domain-containing protein
MFGKRYPLFRLFGFQVSVDASWFFLFLLISWSLATGVFPSELKQQASVTYWLMGIAGAVGLFGSIVFHELCHSLVARRFALPIRGITLFIFGGVAEMTDEPASPKVEFFMAIAGPVSSVFLGIALRLVAALGFWTDWSPQASGVLAYLGSLNLVLAAFNMLPAFPLDGGRVFRSIVWALNGKLRRATHVAARVGAAFGIGFMVLGALRVIVGASFIGGLWLFVIGMFLRHASQMSYRQVLIRGAITGEPLRRFISENPVVVSPSETIDHLVDDYVYRHDLRTYPVVQSGHLVGCVGIDQINKVPRSEWGQHTVGEIATRCSAENTIRPDADVAQALNLLNRTGAEGLMVAQGDELVGFVNLKDLMRFLASKIELGEARA